MGALLWLIGILFIIVLVFWAAWRTTRLVQSGLAKFLVFIASLTIIFSSLGWALFGKHYIAQREFHRLCKEDPGVEVFKSVELPASYFAQNGFPDFQGSKKPGVSSEVAGRYVSIHKNEEISTKYNIQKWAVIYQDYETGEVLGKVTSLRFFGASRLPVPGHVNAVGCPNRIVKDMFETAQKQIFLRSNDK